MSEALTQSSDVQKESERLSKPRARTGQRLSKSRRYEFLTYGLIGGCCFGISIGFLTARLVLPLDVSKPQVSTIQSSEKTTRSEEKAPIRCNFSILETSSVRAPAGDLTQNECLSRVWLAVAMISRLPEVNDLASFSGMKAAFETFKSELANAKSSLVGVSGENLQQIDDVVARYDAMLIAKFDEVASPYQ